MQVTLSKVNSLVDFPSWARCDPDYSRHTIGCTMLRRFKGNVVAAFAVFREFDDDWIDLYYLCNNNVSGIKLWKYIITIYPGYTFTYPCEYIDKYEQTFYANLGFKWFDQRLLNDGVAVVILIKTDKILLDIYDSMYQLGHNPKRRKLIENGYAWDTENEYFVENI